MTLYSIVGKTEEQVVKILKDDGYTNTGVSNSRGVVVFQKEKKILHDYALPFINNGVSIKRFVYIVLIPVENNKKYFYWFRRGSDKSSIDRFKNVNMGMYYISNCSDHEKYPVTAIKKVEFKIFGGEKIQTSSQNKDHKILSEEIAGLNTYREGIQEVTIKVGYGSEVYDDLGLICTREISFTNGISCVLDLSKVDVLDEIHEICKNIYTRYNGKRAGMLKKIRKQTNIAIDSSVKAIGLFELDQACNLSISYIKSADDIEGSKKYFGIFEKNDKTYYINTNQEIYLMDFDFTSRSLILSTPSELGKKILKILNVEKYDSEVDFINQVINSNDRDLLVHKLHPNHYWINKKSKFELCDVIIVDKKINQVYLVFIKYKYLASSSEVLWQSTFVHNKIKNIELDDDKLIEYYKRQIFLITKIYIRICLRQQNSSILFCLKGEIEIQKIWIMYMIFYKVTMDVRILRL